VRFPCPHHVLSFAIHGHCLCSILNKLTLEKFDKLTNQLLDVGIANEHILRLIIALLFEKALDEPKFSGLYAKVITIIAITITHTHTHPSPS
jgi:hypothetical protein